MTNNFITLTQTNDKLVNLNAMFIESIEEMDDDTMVTLGFGSKNFYRVKETPKEVIKKIENTGIFKTFTYGN